MYNFFCTHLLIRSPQDCTKDTQIEAANGQRFSAFNVVSLTLRFFREHALRELSHQCGTTIDNDDVRWVVTVPAIWNEQAKKFMRLAAYEVEIKLVLPLKFPKITITLVIV